MLFIFMDMEWMVFIYKNTRIWLKKGVELYNSPKREIHSKKVIEVYSTICVKKKRSILENWQWQLAREV
jgi:hypothetical protein